MDDARERLCIVLHPSRVLILALGIAYTGAAACVLSLDVGPVFDLPVLALLTLSAVCDLGSRVRRNGRMRLSEIRVAGDGEWSVVRAKGDAVRGRPRPVHLVHELAVAFTLESGGGHRDFAVLVLPDMCRAAAFRALRARLREPGNGGRR